MKKNLKTLSLTKLELSFLRACKKAGYTKVSIGQTNRLIKSSIDSWIRIDNKIFFNPIESEEYPSMWKICDKLLIVNGCAGKDYIEIKTNRFRSATFFLENGIWTDIERGEKAIEKLNLI